MTRRATFGDFATSVTQHLRLLQWPNVPSAAGERTNAATVVADLSCAVHALSCYAEDVSGVFEAEYLAGDRELGVWVRAAARAREALTIAAAALPAALRPEEVVSANALRRGSGDLRAATRSMTLGRDLLHTHETIQSDRSTVGGSEWTPVISSAPVACAILHEVGGWARQIAGHAYPSAWSARHWLRPLGPSARRRNDVLCAKASSGCSTPSR